MYNKELKPGIQAIVIGFKTSPINLGKNVTLTSFHKKGEVIPFDSGGVVAGLDCWLVEGINLSRVLRDKSTGNTVERKTGHQGVFKPAHLMPIYPEADPLSLEIKEKENIQ